MSRCFPFPPPGYEKKARLDDADLLTKEKFKEKKHKKDKKDKDKRENKEKNKNRNKEKHSEKKERKEKHRDKDKSKDEGGNWAQSEKRVEGHKECHSGEEKLVPNGQQSCEVNGSKYVHDLDHRIKAEDRASGSQELHNVTASDKKSAELPKKIEEKPEEDDRKVNKHRNHVKEKHGTNSVCPNFSNMRQRRIEEITMPFDKHVEKHNEGKNDNKEKDTTQGNGREKKRKSNTKAGAREKEKKEKVEKDKVGKMNKSYIEQPKQIVNGKESINAWNAKMSQLPQMDNNSASGGIQKRKNFEMNGHSHGNGFLPHKVPMLASSHLSTENGKWEPLQVAITHTSNKRPGTTNNGEVDVKKINGFKGHERPIVTPTKPSSSAAVFRKNGEPFAKQSDSKSDNGNGQLFVKLSDPESNNGNGQLFVKLSDPVSNIGNGEPLTNTPHPDSKYLSQILSVLEMGELSDYDQEWLSNGNNLQSKRPKMSPPRTEGSSQVWEQTLQINYADVFALPYVIPY